MKFVQVNAATKKKKFTKEIRIFLIVVVTLITMLVKIVAGIDINQLFGLLGKLIGADLEGTANAEVLILFFELVFFNNLLNVDLSKFDKINSKLEILKKRFTKLITNNYTNEQLDKIRENLKENLGDEDLLYNELKKKYPPEKNKDIKIRIKSLIEKDKKNAALTREQIKNKLFTTNNEFSNTIIKDYKLSRKDRLNRARREIIMLKKIFKENKLIDSIIDSDSRTNLASLSPKTPIKSAISPSLSSKTSRRTVTRGLSSLRTPIIPATSSISSMGTPIISTTRSISSPRTPIPTMSSILSPRTPIIPATSFISSSKIPIKTATNSILRSKNI